MAAEVRRAKKTFNVISVALIDQLLSLFKDEPKLLFFKQEMRRLSADKKQDHVPSANFFQTMNIETKIEPSDETRRTVGGDKVVVGELVIRKDERLFGPDVGVSIAALEALNLKERWPKLSKANQEMVWDYLIRMAKSAAQVVFGMQMMDPKMQEIMKSLQSKCTLAPGASEEEFAAFASQVKAAMASSPSATAPPSK